MLGEATSARNSIERPFRLANHFSCYAYLGYVRELGFRLISDL